MSIVHAEASHGPVDTADRNVMLDVARRCADYICGRNPFVRMLAVSGSLTRPEHRGVHHDIDYFVLANKGRIWEGFMACVWLGWRFSRRMGVPRTFFCFNYVVDEAHLEEIDLSRAEYVREFLRLEVLAGMETYADLLERFRARLAAVDPVLYEQARRRVRESVGHPGSGAAPLRPSSSPSPRPWPALCRLLRYPFIATAKWMEARRRGRYPGGLIYSNGRVVRSHFRRSWGDTPLDPEGIAASEAFTRVAGDYDQKVVSSRSNRHMRSIVREALTTLVRPGDRVLDLGAGTGVDAVWLAERGASVLAVDVSEGMVKEASRRVEMAGVQERVEVRRLPIEELRALLPRHARSYDLVLADFGALNLSGDPDRWGPVVARLLKPGGHLVATVMGRWSLWELLAGFLRGRPSFALRRVRGEPIRIGGVPLVATLYTPGAFARRLRTHFRVSYVRGLCTLAPPPALEHLGAALPRVWSALAWLDRRLGGWPVLRALGDHFMIVLEQESRPILSYRTRGPITASPVVADANGDGSPEVVVAADRLYVLDRRGRDIRGWPRRVGGPMASTPRVVALGEQVGIFVGSDDDRLHAHFSDGRPLDGFPFRTRGDVFSTPLVEDLDGDGSPEIAFGSDDGGIYVLDSNGRQRSGWPVTTGGYVSASPTAAQLNGSRVFVIGSWDGRLYALDHNGGAVPGWPRDLGFPIWASAAVADVDGDGSAEIVAATQRLFVLRGDGSPMEGFPVRLGGYAVGSPAVGDIDGDGRPEIVVCSDRVYAFDAGGSPVAGFPVDVGAYIWASPILVDVDGDGRPEIVVGDFDGNLWAVTGAGEVAAGYPKRIGSRITAAATAADLDGDGYVELLVASSDGDVVALPTEGRDDRASVPWPSFPPAASATPLDGGAKGPGGRPRSTVRPAGSPRTLEQVSAVATASGNGPAPDVPIGPEAVRLVTRGRWPHRVTEVHLDLPTGVRLEGGMLHYTVNGRVHPSPLLGANGRYFALIQPLRPLKGVDFVLELEMEGGGGARLPRSGTFRTRVGVPGLRLRA